MNNFLKAILYINAFLFLIAGAFAPEHRSWLEANNMMQMGIMMAILAEVINDKTS